MTPAATLLSRKPFLTRDALRDGTTAAELARSVEHRHVRRVFRGVYVVADRPDTRELRIEALQLVLPPHAVVCGPTAAWVLGLDLFPPRRRFDFVPECLVPVGSNRVRRTLVRAREALIDPADTLMVDGVRLTRPLRIAADALRQLRRPYALSAADTLAHAGLLDLDHLTAYLEALHGFRGIRQARELAQLVDARAESPGESWQRLRYIDAGFPTPETQIEVCDHNGVPLARLDMGYRALRIGSEYDGIDWHSSDADRIRDETRRGFLTETLGWRILVARKGDVLGDDPWMERDMGEMLGIQPRLPRSW